MNKKGMGWSTIVVIIILVVSFIILLGWQISFGKSVKEGSEETKCKLSIIQAKSLIGAMKTTDLPRLSCSKIPVEIKAENEEDAIKELTEMINDASNTFCGAKIFTKIGGRYCRRRYHPITFTNKKLKISTLELENSLKQKNLKCGFGLVKEGIDTSKEYSILFVADFSLGPGKWIYNALMFKIFEKTTGAENEGVILIESSRIFEQKCTYLI